jgi:hypothetical protein
VQERRHGRCGRAFDDQLAAFHYPDHRVEDVAVGQGHDLVDVSLHDREVQLADSSYA